MNTNLKRIILASAVSALLPLIAQAQNVWLATSATQVDKDAQNPYVTIDASASGEAFVARNPIALDGLTVTDPDGNPVVLENKLLGKTRSSADLKLTKPGTYKVGVEIQNVVVTYRQAPAAASGPAAGAPPAGGARAGMVRKQMSPEEYQTFKLPDDATQVRITKNLRRVETFVTYDRPSSGVFKAAGVGLELVPITHPNDILPEQTAKFRLLLNGKPLPDFTFTAVPAGQLYRGVLKEIRTTTDAQGIASLTLPEGGRYWLSASYPVRGTPAAPADATAAPVTVDAYAYGAALEVLY